MIFKRFNHIVILYIIVIMLFFGVGIYILTNTYFWLSSIWLFVADLVIIYWFVRFINREHRKLAGFITSISQEDFSAPYSKSYLNDDLNAAFQKLANVIGALRDEVQINLQFLQTIINQVNVAIICVDKDENISIVNDSAKRLFNKRVLRNIDSLIIPNDDLPLILRSLKPSEKKLIKIFFNDELSNYSVETIGFKLSNNYYRLYSFHNVQSELEQNELIAWQKLTRVITHEIMNSAIPISNLSDLVYNQLFINNETFNNNLNTEQTEDIKEGLKTIESRSKALVKFVDATRNFTKMPKPELEIIQVDMILQKVLSLLKVRIEEAAMEVKVNIVPDDLKLLADSSMLEQVLINIILNAIDSFNGKNQNRLKIIAEKTSDNHIHISISDNGKGIEHDKLDHIFVPFFTTKINGSGIGLSLSKQIMYLHKGNISVKSEPEKGTTFTLTF